MASVFQFNKESKPNKATTDKKGSTKRKASVFKNLPEEEEKLEQNESADLGNFLEDEDLQRQIERSSAQSLQGFGEGLLGAPGDIADLLNKTTGGKSLTLQTLSDILPTSGRIKEFGEKATRGYTKPQNKFEETAKEFMSDVGSFSAFPQRGTLTKGGKILNAAREWRPLIVPFLGQTTKKAAQALGSDENSSDFWKMGSMIVSDVLLNKGRGSQGFINDLFSKADAALPAGARTSSNRMRNSLLILKNDLEKGGTAPDKTAALKKIDEALGKMTRRGRNFFIDVSELPAFRKSINSIREGLGGWGSELGYGGKKKAIANLEAVKKIVIDTGMDYGNRANPQFAKNWSAANEAANIRSKSNVAMGFLEKVLGGKVVSKLLGGGAVGHAAGAAAAGHSALGTIAKGVAATSVAGGIGAGAYNIGKLTYRMSKSPVLRKYYTDLFKASAKEDAVLVEKYAGKIKREEEKEKKKEEVLIKSILAR